MNIIGRQKKCADLQRYIKSNHSEFAKIENRQNAFIPENNLRKGVFLTLITCNGVVDNEYTSDISNILTIDDLY